MGSADITQLSDADLLALSRQQQLSAIPDDQLLQMATPAKPPVTAADRVQAGEAGILRGGAYLLGSIPDVLPNVAGLATSAYDAYQHYVNGKDWADLPRPVKPNAVSEGITNVMDKSPITTTQLARPDDAASRYLSTAGSVVPGAIAGGGNVVRTLASTVPPALVGHAVAEAKPFSSPVANQVASLTAQLLAQGAMPRGTVDTPSAKVSNLTVEDAQGLGLKIPPATTNNSIKNRLIESIAGKRNVEQRAQVLNTEGVNQAARNDLQLPGKGPITDSEIAQIKADARPAYQAARQAGPIRTGSDPAFAQTLAAVEQKYTGASRVLSDPGSQALSRDIQDILAKPAHDASDLLDTVDILRDRAQQNFRAGNNGLGSAYRQVGKAIEDQIEQSNPGPAMQGYRAARQRLAILHTVEDARNPGSGNVSGGKLGSMLNHGQYMSGDLETVARAANLAPRAFAEPTHSAGVNHLGLWGTILGGMALGHEAHPGGIGVALGAVPGGLALGREGAAQYALGPGQSGALQTQRAPMDVRTLAAALAAARAQ